MNVRVFPLTRAAPGENDVLVAQGAGPGGGTDDALEVVQPPGLRARPPVRSTTEALVVELPNGERFAFIVDKGAKDGAVALEAGETQLHGCAAPASVVRLRASGDIDVVTAPGRVVRLQGATQPFVCGAVYADALGLFLGALGTFVTGVGTVVAAVGVFCAATAAHPLLAPVLNPGPLGPAAVLVSAINVFAATTTTFGGAITTFANARAAYLSTRVLGE